ncbi:MAG: hypothetical protein JG782_666 [Anaerophaga sp.]|nr:hypothetical protein [Anaerophaga sp.]MDI3521050.1 hypothetical protein [Anaerophaga sp.]MDK2840951.1 hypothetical protein [Anaerophaga sp.]MDN5290281.1 hypothetical protein [Anaerophaga sp.]
MEPATFCTCSYVADFFVNKAAEPEEESKRHARFF